MGVSCNCAQMTDTEKPENEVISPNVSSKKIIKTRFISGDKDMPIPCRMTSVDYGKTIMKEPDPETIDSRNTQMLQTINWSKSSKI